MITYKEYKLNETITRRPPSNGLFSAQNKTHQLEFEPTTSCLPGRRTTNCTMVMRIYNLVFTRSSNRVEVWQNLQKTRRERLKSALYLGLKKRKTLFFEKKLEIFEFFFGKCCIVSKNVRGGPFGIYQHTFSCKIFKKTRKGDLLRHLKNSE